MFCNVLLALQRHPEGTEAVLVMAFLRCVWIGVLLLPWCPDTGGSCIFDTVQRSVHVVSPPVKLQKPVVTASEENPKPHRSEPQRSRRATRDVQSDPQPIRIKTWIPRTSPGPSERERERIMAAVNEAVGQVSSLLSVRGVSDRLLLNRDLNKYCKFIWRNSSSLNYMKCGRAKDIYRSENCLDVTIPDEHLDGCSVYPHPDQPIPRVLRPEGAGVPDTDFLLYVFIHSTDKCRAEAGVLAYSAHCQTDSTGRPLAGVMVVCREQLTEDKYSHHHIVQTVLHELFHVLGFSKDLYSRWVDCSLSSQIGEKCWSRGHVTSTDETGQARLYSPAVSRTMKEHLNSTHTDLGAPLENMDAGSDGVSSHWEARVLQGSIMTAVLVEPSLVRIDPFTLAALQDTGWYSVNLSRAQSLIWGEGEGDQFGSSVTCHNSSAFFCTGSGLGCHYLHLHKGTCLTDRYLDGCYVFKPLTDASECWMEENQRDGGQVSGEIFGPDSRCFISNLTTRKTLSSVSGSVAGHCYRHRCSGVNRYQIQVNGSDWLDCPAGRSIEVPGYQGVISCPDERLCKYPDLAPPIVRQTARPNSVTPSDRAHDVTGARPRVTFDLSCVSSVVLSLAAAASLLASAALICCSCCSVRVRVHVALEGLCRQPSTSARPV